MVSAEPSGWVILTGLEFAGMALASRKNTDRIMNRMTFFIYASFIIKNGLNRMQIQLFHVC